MITRAFTSISSSRLPPRLSVLGYLKVGGVSDLRYSRDGKPYSLPTRYVDPVRFEITTREKDVREVAGKAGSKVAGETFRVNLGYRRNEALHEKVGKAPVELAVRLMFDRPDQNLISFLGAHDGKRWICQGDGENGLDVGLGPVACTCPRLKQHEGGGALPDRVPCKPHGTLSVVLEEADTFGGFYQFKTSSWESIANLRTQLQLLERSFGSVAGLPLTLQVYPATKQYQDGSGGGVTTQPIVTLVLRGSFDTARQIAASAVAEHRQYLLAAGGGPDPELHREVVWCEMEAEAGEVGAEFYPEAQQVQDRSALRVILSSGPAPAGVEEEEEEEGQGEEGGPGSDPLLVLLDRCVARGGLLNAGQVDGIRAIAAKDDLARRDAAVDWLTELLEGGAA